MIFIVNIYCTVRVSVMLWQDGIPVRSREWLRCLCPLPGNHFHGHFIHIRQGKERNPHELAAFDLTVIDFCPMTMWVLYVGCRKHLLYRFFRPLKTAATSTTDLLFFFILLLLLVFLQYLHWVQDTSLLPVNWILYLLHFAGVITQEIFAFQRTHVWGGVRCELKSFIQSCNSCRVDIFFEQTKTNARIYPAYHTAYDTFDYCSRFIDPGK